MIEADKLDYIRYNSVACIGFSWSVITSDGGVLLLRAIEQRLLLTERIAKQIPDSRDPIKIQNPIVDLMRQRVYVWYAVMKA